MGFFKLLKNAEVFLPLHGNVVFVAQIVGALKARPGCVIDKLGFILPIGCGDGALRNGRRVELQLTQAVKLGLPGRTHVLVMLRECKLIHRLLSCRHVLVCHVADRREAVLAIVEANMVPI